MYRLPVPGEPVPPLRGLPGEEAAAEGRQAGEGVGGMTWEVEEANESLRRVLYAEFTTLQIMVGMYRPRPDTHRALMEHGNSIIERVMETYSERPERDEYCRRIRDLLDKVQEYYDGLSAREKWELGKRPNERLSAFKKRLDC